MKIEYNLNQNYLKYYNEANGIVLLKQKLKKNQNIKIRGYISQMTRIFSLYYIIALFFAILCTSKNLQLFSDLLIGLMAFIGVAYFASIALLFVGAKSKINSKTGILEIDKDGIIDTNENKFKISIPYKQIELIVITKKVMVFVTKIPIVIIVANNNLDVDKIIAEIKKYSDVQIILNNK